MLLAEVATFSQEGPLHATAQPEETCRHDHAMIQVGFETQETWARFSGRDCVKQTRANDAQCIPCMKNLSDGTQVERFQGPCKRDATVLASQIFTPWHFCHNGGGCPQGRLPKWRGRICWAFNKGEFTRFSGPAGVCIKDWWRSRHIPTVSYAKANMAHHSRNVADFIAAYQWSMEQRASQGDRPETVMTCQLFCGEEEACGDVGDCTCGEACVQQQETNTSATTTSTIVSATADAMRPVHDGDTIWLRAHTGKYLTVQGKSLHAKWTDRLSWQAFVIEKASSENWTVTSGDAIFLRAHTGMHVTVGDIFEAGRFEATVHANWSHRGSWQRMIIEKKGTDGPIHVKDTIYLRAHTGKLIAVEGTSVQAKWDHMGTWQALVLESDDAAARAA